MLILGGEPFATGCARYADSSPEHPDEPKIYARIRFMALPFDVHALVDTASAYSVIHEEDADELDFSSEGLTTERLVTPYGTVAGILRRGSIILMADEGESLRLDPLWFVCPDWYRGRIVLGYRGLLEHIRFAVDPSTNTFYFGACP